MSIDFYSHTKKVSSLKNPNKGKTHNIELPTRILINGQTGSGKTHTLLELIHKLGSVFFQVVVCVKDRDEPLYDLLNEQMNNQVQFYEGMIPVEGKKNKLQPNVPLMKDLAQKDDKGFLSTLIVFDDCVNDKIQDRIVQYFIAGRKKNITCVYLSQSYYDTPKIIRQQCQHVFLKRGASPKDMRSLLREHTSGMSLDDLTRAYNRVCTDHKNFLALNLSDRTAHRNFDVEPMTMGAPTKDDVKEIDIQVPTRKYKNKYVSVKRTLTRESVDLFCEMLKKANLDDEYLFQDILNHYKEWCSDNGLQAGGFTLLGKGLREHFVNFRRNNQVWYKL